MRRTDSWWDFRRALVDVDMTLNVLMWEPSFRKWSIQWQLFEGWLKSYSCAMRICWDTG